MLASLVFLAVAAAPQVTTLAACSLEIGAVFEDAGGRPREWVPQSVPSPQVRLERNEAGDIDVRRGEGVGRMASRGEEGAEITLLRRTPEETVVVVVRQGSEELYRFRNPGAGRGWVLVLETAGPRSPAAHVWSGSCAQPLIR